MLLILNKCKKESLPAVDDNYTPSRRTRLHSPAQQSYPPSLAISCTPLQFNVPPYFQLWEKECHLRWMQQRNMCIGSDGIGSLVRVGFRGIEQPCSARKCQFYCMIGWSHSQILIQTQWLENLTHFSESVLCLHQTSVSKHRKNCECCPVSQLIVR